MKEIRKKMEELKFPHHMVYFKPGNISTNILAKKRFPHHMVYFKRTKKIYLVVQEDAFPHHMVYFKQLYEIKRFRVYQS